MIIHRLNKRHDLVTVTPEQPDDLWTLRRVVTKGDRCRRDFESVQGLGEYSRPDKERIKVTVTVEVEAIHSTGASSRLKVSGKIVDVSNELLSERIRFILLPFPKGTESP